MNQRLQKSFIALSLCLCLITVMFTGCSSPQTAEPATRTVVDAYGREVTVPATIERIALTTSFPVYLSFVCAFGEQDKVVTGLPSSFNRDTYQFDFLFAPQVANAPTILDSSSGDVNVEELLALEPDVVIVHTKELAETLSAKGLNVIGIQITDFQAFREIIRVFGDLFEKQDIAAQYLTYLDDTLQLVEDRTADIPEAEKKRVLYFDKARMMRPTTNSEWWIPAAGGISCTAANATQTKFQMDIEAVYNADPDIIIEMLAANVPEIYADPLWADLDAVINKQVFNTPVGCHLMGQWTSEQPLLILWLAKTFYPEQFADIDLTERFIDFYSTFYHVDVTAEQVAEIIAGGAQ